MPQRDRSIKQIHIHWAIALLLFAGLTTSPLSAAHADMGPKPSMEFEFEFQTESPLTIVDGVQYECEDATCADAGVLEEMGPQGFSCVADSCSSMAYGYAPYHQLEITFSDGITRRSQIFEYDAFNMRYRVIVREDDLRVERISGRHNPMGWFFLGVIVAGIVGLGLFLTNLVLLVILILRAGEDRATWQDARGVYIGLWATMIPFIIFGGFFSWAIPLTVCIEACLGLLYAVIRQRHRFQTLSLISMVNLITLPLLWVTIQYFFGAAHWAVMLLAETLVWLIEALLLWATQRKSLHFSEALLLSFALNTTSLLIGLLLPL